MKRPNLRMLNPGATLRSAVLGAPVRMLGVAPAVSRPQPKATAAFYGTSEWKQLLAQIIRERGRRCQDARCRTPHRGEGRRIYGDHIVELKDNGAPLDPANVLLRCAACHGRKTWESRRARGATSESGRGPFHRTGGSSLESAPRPDGFFPTRNRP